MNSGDRCQSGDRQFDMTNTSFGGAWTEEKLEILESYLDAYTTALKNQPFQLIYVDAFAGEGYWRPNRAYSTDGYADFAEMRDGSSRIALSIQNRSFDRFVFIEKDVSRYEELSKLETEFPNRNIQIENDDANDALVSFCNTMGNFDRAVVFLDPFATEVSWESVATLAETRKVDCWILFPLGATARMMPTDREPSDALAAHLDRIFGGTEHWQNVYNPSRQLSMFSSEPNLERTSGSDQIADNYRNRLEGAFARVATTRRTLRNSRNSPMFELFFAASNPRGASIAQRIADDILRRGDTTDG